MSSLINSMVILLTESKTAQSKSSMGQIPLSRASLKTLITRLMKLCVFSKHHQNHRSSREDNDVRITDASIGIIRTDASRDDLNDNRMMMESYLKLEQPLRLTLYSCIARILMMSSKFDEFGQERPLEEIYESNVELVDALFKGILRDLVEVENQGPYLKASRTHNALIQRKLLFNCQVR